MNTDGNGVLYSKTTVSETNPPKDRSFDKNADNFKKEQPPLQSGENSLNKASDKDREKSAAPSTPEPRSAAVKTTAKPRATAIPADKSYDEAPNSAASGASGASKPQSTPAPRHIDTAAPEQADNNTPNDEGYSFTAEYSFPTADTAKKSLVLSINSSDYKAAQSMEDEFSLYGEGPDIASYEDWDNGKYFEYLGRNITEDIMLPQDFEYTGGNEFLMSTDQSGSPVMDKRIFPYEGMSGRYITVITSKNSADVYSRLHDPNYILSDIYGTDAVIIGTDGGYKCYIIYEGISYIITADGINVDELKQILASVTEEEI